MRFPLPIIAVAAAPLPAHVLQVMRLEKIRLSGFKSFVDPTTIVLSSNLVGIVGPNGCGKSNVIDAVRWVMGESSVKHLRGDTMADVIFTGSATRKAVNLASVELVFDNGAGRLGGEYAGYREISIKRQVTRDGQSVYFLNGARCRRRDITDIFLGTGLGARSYAIIEQGMISRLIEAKPEELREVLEEAAGISKYKERRHETEIRIRHTRENLARLQDVLGEVDKQIASLQRQAKKAERFVRLRDSERRCKRELLALRWRRQDAGEHSAAQRMAELDAALQAREAEAEACAQALAAGQDAHRNLQAELEREQGRVYELGAEIGRLENAIRAAETARNAAEQELARIEQELQRALHDADADRAQLGQTRTELDSTRNKIKDLAANHDAALQRRGELDAQVQAQEAEQQQRRQRLNHLQKEIEVRRARAKQLVEAVNDHEARLVRLHTEQTDLMARLAELSLEPLDAALAEHEQARAARQDQLREATEGAQRFQEELKDLRRALQDATGELHTVRGQIASLELLQDHAVGRDRKASRQWLESLGLADAERLGETMVCAEGWDAAVELVLGTFLEAVCGADLEQAAASLEALGADRVALLERGPRAAARGGEQAEPLHSKVDSPWPMEGWLSGVYCAPDLAAALLRRAHLGPDESVVTPNCEWLGPNWMVVRRANDERTGVIARASQLRDFRRAVAALEADVAALQTRIQVTETAFRTAESEREAVRVEEHRLASALAALRAQRAGVATRRSETERRLGTVELDIAHVAEQLTRRKKDLETVEDTELCAQLSALSAEEKAALPVLDALHNDLRSARQAVASLRDALVRERAREESLAKSESLTAGHLTRSETAREQTAARRDELQTQLAGFRDDPARSERLAALRDARAAAEQALKEHRQANRDAEARLRELDAARQTAERAGAGLRQTLDEQRLEREAARVRKQTFEEQLAELGAEVGAVLAELDPEAEEAAWNRRTQELTDEIAKLGAVNLTAMDEVREQTERQTFLQTQYNDLTESLATLEGAMAKIDRECKTRFKETYDRVNSGLQNMFPKLFGGGVAQLELTERDLLESGVTIMARPPGKRNSSIQLLSGGEKALTAVALVFAIFELNPAPFCLLDEVDAPLDEANVGRFGGLVKEMSSTVQFLFITHNKATMEIADHLAGVTMKEPGVSRIVAVDMQEALALAQA